MSKTVPGGRFFTYDALNRLASAQDNGHWANTYSYDAWDNLWQKTPGAPAGENMNQAADTGNHLSSYSYDADGNMLTDGINSWTYVYDAENRITTAGGTTYSYDADNRRVKKSSGTNYWYGPGGAIMAETDASSNWTNYIFFGGERLARNVSGDIKYYITDHLHSTAMFVDKAGTTAAILDDNDFYPWGGLVPGVGKTTSNNHYKMTGKERDTESGLDYYGARYYGSTMGRFMSPDWAAKPATVPYAEFGDPQSLNLYSYTRNSPIIRVDGDGHDSNGMLARPGQAGILGTNDGGLGNGNTDQYDVTVTFTNIFINGALVASLPTNVTVQQVGSSTPIYSGPPRSGEGSRANTLMRQAVARIAQSYDGSTQWAFGKAKDRFPANSNKCNQFVFDVLKEAGATASSGRAAWPMPTAAEWANPKFTIKNWRPLGGSESPEPGDVAAYALPGHATYTGHSGIVVGVSSTLTVSAIAAHDTVVGPEDKFQPGVATFRRYTGD